MTKLETKDKRINKAEKGREDSLHLKNTETVRFERGKETGGHSCIIHQGQPHLLIS